MVARSSRKNLRRLLVKFMNLFLANGISVVLGWIVMRRAKWRRPVLRIAYLGQRLPKELLPLIGFRGNWLRRDLDPQALVVLVRNYDG